MFPKAAKRGLFAMDVFSLAGSFAQHAGALQLDDSSMGVIALLAGLFGGYWINGRFEQLKAKRAKVVSRSPRQQIKK
jgi:hypothetical protein